MLHRNRSLVAMSYDEKREILTIKMNDILARKLQIEYGRHGHLYNNPTRDLYFEKFHV